MTHKAKIHIVKDEPELEVKPIGDAPDNVPLDEIHKYTQEQLIGRPAEQKANRILFDFPKAIITNEPPKSVFKRMVSLTQYFKK
jgi:hypothetical protein